MPKLTQGLALTIFLLLAGPSFGQDAVFGGHNIPRMQEGEALKPNGSFYSGGYLGSRDFRPYRIHLYEFRNDRGDMVEWVPWALRITGTEAQGQRMEWADGRDCPEAYGVLAALSDFSTGRFLTPRFQTLPPGARPVPGPPIGMGAPPLAVWGYARLADGARGSMMVTGADGLIRDWVDFADSQLADCWGPERPTFEQRQGPTTPPK